MIRLKKYTFRLHEMHGTDIELTQIAENRRVAWQKLWARMPLIHPDDFQMIKWEYV